ncbi:DNA methyltransferase [Microbacterium sp. Leaf436]|uniref:DNA methyltransferase n=1 Tax=Microbacterium sp. Leaf436 TaxID=1736377 RepID=UPI0006F1C823|nr:DNA methyltransferase [Microbacterium sp. Leaf436]KQT71998.1 hypothetical protein ASG45_13550 [Microbacterium sp. Leaf436]
MPASFAWSDYHLHAFDRKEISQRRLDIAGSRRVSSLPWRGQFSPELAEYLISEFLPAGAVLDPFCGSGTTLIEASRLGRSSLGSEINPAAYLLSRVYELIGMDRLERQRLMFALKRETVALEEAEAAFDRVADWARHASSFEEQHLRNATFLLAAGNDSSVKPGRLRKAVRQVSELIASLPDSDVSVSVALGDARRIEAADQSMSGLLTSPPYINVFNYHQNYRNAVEALGWGVLSSARAEFGSNRKHRQNRFLTVIQYAQDIAEAARESARLLKPGATAVWVVGRESRVRGVAMPNPLIVFEVATRGSGLKLVSKHERSFTSRYGQRVFEDIMVFRHPDDPRSDQHGNLASLGREVGVKVLTSVLEDSGEATSEVEAAIEDAERVWPSVRPEFSGPDTHSVRDSPLALVP